MAAAIPAELRREIVALSQSGKSAKAISEQLGLGYPGVAKVLRLYRLLGEEALSLGYHRCGRHSPYGAKVRQAISAQIGINENLGAPIIRSRLLEKPELGPIPHERTIQRWWQVQGISKPRGRRPRQDRSYTGTPHDTWQIDGKENIELADGEKTCYLSFTDEATCSFFKGHVFPLGASDAKC